MKIMRILKFNESNDNVPMKAYLVTFEPMVRVVVPEYMSEDEITEIARSKALDVMMNDGIYDHFQGIKVDDLVPFSPTNEKDKSEQEKYYDDWKDRNTKKFDL